jgi:hypothetical protein
VIRLRSFQSLIIGLLSVFLLLPGQAIGTVLCIEADGHIALEMAKNGRCGNPASEALREHSEQTPLNTDHCGSCVDVSLSASHNDDQQIFSALSASPKLEAPVLALAPWVVLLALELAFTPFWLYPSSVTHTTLSALRTVILLV